MKFDNFSIVLSLLCSLISNNVKPYFNISVRVCSLRSILSSTIIVNWCFWHCSGRNTIPEKHLLIMEQATSVVISENFVYDTPCPNRETVVINSVLLVNSFICNGNSIFLGVSFFPLCNAKNKSWANDNDSRFIRSDFGDDSLLIYLNKNSWSNGNSGKVWTSKSSVSEGQGIWYELFCSSFLMQFAEDTIHCCTSFIFSYFLIFYLLLEQKLSRIETFARKKNSKIFGINFCEWQDNTRFARNKLSRIGRNQKLRGHKLSRGWNRKKFTSFSLH